MCAAAAFLTTVLHPLRINVCCAMCLIGIFAIIISTEEYNHKQSLRMTFIYLYDLYLSGAFPIQKSIIVECISLKFSG